jgi:hypothetical protein
MHAKSAFTIVALVLVTGFTPLGRAASATTGWSIELLYGRDEIFPSVLASVTRDAPFPPPLAGAVQLGDPTGLISAQLVAPRDNCLVTVTLGATELFDQTTITIQLPVKGRPYRVAPWLRLNHRQLLNIRHPIAGELLTMSVTLDGATETKTRTVRVHAINDCLTSMYQDGRIYEVGFLAAAYVNEYNPDLFTKITRHALDHGYVTAFDGYESDNPKAVTQQVEAIYRTLHDLGFKYSALTQSSVNTTAAGTQWIRFTGESLTSDQANCVDGTVLFASILTQLNLRVVIFYIPYHHAFLGVYRTPRMGEEEGFDVVETTVVSDEPFSKSLQRGQDRLALERSRADNREIRFVNLLSPTQLYSWDPKQPGKTTVFFNIDVAACRVRGILPIAEMANESN